MKNLFAMLCLFFGLFPFGGASKPAWVKKEPRDPNFYSTTVKMPKKNNPNFKEDAHQNALRSISMQISVQVLSQLELADFEESGINWSEYQSRITTESKTFLKNVELVDTHESKRHYWAYYRLDKAAYNAEREMMKERALRQAGEYLALYDEKLRESEMGLTLLIKALEELEDFLDMDLSLLMDGERVNIRNEIVMRMEDLALNVNISLSQNELTRIAHHDQMDVFDAKVLYKKDGKDVALKNFPLALRFTTGEGQITRKTTTGNAGRTIIEIGKILSFEPRQEIVVETDHNYYRSMITSDYVCRIYDNLNFKPETIKLEVSKPAIYIDYSLDGVKKDARGNPVYNLLPQFNLDVKDSQDDAQYILRLNALSRKGEYQEQLKLHFAYVVLELQLIEKESGKTLHSQGFAEAKAGAQREELAIPQAEKKALDELCGISLRNIIWQSIFSPPSW